MTCLRCLYSQEGISQPGDNGTITNGTDSYIENLFFMHDGGICYENGRKRASCG